MRRVAAAALVVVAGAACASRSRTVRIVPITDSGANLARTELARSTTPTHTYPPVPAGTVVQVFAEFFRATAVYASETASPTARGRVRRGKPATATPSAAVTATQTHTVTRAPTEAAYELPARANRSFGPGEKLVFAVQYMGITGGYATMEIPSVGPVPGGPASARAFQIRTTARSTPLFSTFFRVEDEATSYLDVGRLFSHRFEKRIREGGFRPRPQHWSLDHVAETAVDHDGRVSRIVRGAQDILSAFYYFRTMPLPERDWVAIPVFADGKMYELLVRIARREQVTVPVGTFRTLVVEPQLKFEGIFQQKGRVTVWLTDDARRVPVLVRSKIVIGSIDILLVDARVIEPVDSGS